MYVLKSVILSVIIFVCAVGCGLSDDSPGSPDDLPDTWLSEMLRTFPEDMESAYISRVWIADYEAGNSLAFPGGIVHRESISVPLGGFGEDWRQIHDAVGLDFRNRDKAVWLHGEAFGIHTGDLGDLAQIRKRLADAGYDRYDYGGVEFYRFAPSIGSAVKKHPQGSILYGLINNIAFVDDRTLITARHTRDLKWIVDVREGLARSMWDEKRWRTLAMAVGDEMLGGLLIAPEYILSPFETEDGAITRIQWWAGTIVEGWSRYVEGPDAWGTLEPYTASAIGLTMRTGAPGALIALYHPDPESANKNALELKHRWKSAHMDLRGERTSLGTPQESRQGQDIPFTELCAPLETRTLVFDESSVLLAYCPAIERETPFVGARGTDFYWGVFNYNELHFLVPDITILASE